MHERDRKKIYQAREELAKKKPQIQPDHIVAALSFGFWTSLFDTRYEHNQILWPRLLKPTFSGLPKGQRTRLFLSRELNRTRFLRNRISHYEPIWHWQDLATQHDMITNLLGYLSPAASQYLGMFGRFKTIYFDGKPHIETRLKALEGLHITQRELITE